MPRKTKKDKMIARLRRKLAEQRIRNEKREVSLPAQAGREVRMRDEEEEKHSPPLLTYPVNLIKKDLTKTLGLAILAISLEIGIYYLSKLEFLPF